MARVGGEEDAVDGPRVVREDGRQPEALELLRALVQMDFPVLENVDK